MRAVDQSLTMPLTFFLAGIFMVAFAASGLFFFRSWRKSGDRFFLWFALACWFISVDRVVWIVFVPDLEAQAWGYLLRLISFLLILYAIYETNRRKR